MDLPNQTTWDCGKKGNNVSLPFRGWFGNIETFKAFPLFLFFFNIYLFILPLRVLVVARGILLCRVGCLSLRHTDSLVASWACFLHGVWDLSSAVRD